MSFTPVLVAALLGASGVAANATPGLHHSRQDAGIPRVAWQLLPTGSEEQFRGLAPVNDHIAWVSGTNGTVLKTTDGGANWVSTGPQLSEADAELQYRDIQAWSAEKAVILSIGEGNSSRIYITSDGGATWSQTFTNGDDNAFYDCVAFEDEQHGLAMSDPVDGKFRLIETLDGGGNWAIVDPSGMPPALENESGFAASGTCLTTSAGRWYIGSGGVNPGRIFASADGHTWQVANSTIAGGDSTGVFSVQFRDATHGIAVGGNYTIPTGNANSAAWSDDGGLSWTAASRFPSGYRSGCSWVPGRCAPGTAIAVGPSGSDITVDGGRTWHGFDNGTFDSVECVDSHTCWASGSGGRVARLVFE